jgi:transcriptional regulator with XRE-family HTH domain
MPAPASTPEPELTELGRYLEDARETAGLSKRAAAGRAGISEGRWRQITRGFQPAGEHQIPANPKKDTVARMARAVRANVLVAQRLAGFEVPDPDPDVTPDGKFGKWLVEKRQMAGFGTSADLAEAANLGADEIRDWEEGRARPEIWQITALARVLDVSEFEALAMGDYLPPEIAETLTWMTDPATPPERVAEVQRYLRFMRSEGATG